MREALSARSRSLVVTKAAARAVARAVASVAAFAVARTVACVALVGMSIAPLARAADTPTSTDPLTDALWMRFNFIPGDQVLFVEDFAQDTLGAAPRRLTFASGSGVLEDWSGGRFVRIDEPALIELGMNESLQRNFTIELELGLDSGTFELEAFNPIEETAEPERIHIAATTDNGAATGGIRRAEGDRADLFELTQQPLRVSFTGEISRARVWVNGKELADVADSRFARSNQLRLRFDPKPGHPIRLGSIAVASAARQLQVARFKVERSIVSHGILWNGDALRPESAPTLRWIIDSLRQDQTLRLRLSVNGNGAGGDGTALLATVRQAKTLETFLRARGGIGPQQVVVEGVGNQKRMVPPDTPEARWMNERVEISKQ